jgi:Reverse transcriptase (RNA-dependent DNA polymerase)
MLIASKDKTVIETLASQISNTFELKCLGEVKQFIGINVKRQSDGIFSINQSQYITKIAETFQLQDAKGSLYPLDSGYFKINDDNLLGSNNEYRKVIGMLLYISTNTRPDISAAVGILAQRLSKPKKVDLTESFRVIKYLLKTQNHSLVLGNYNSSSLLVAYTDANWAENRVDRKSTSGFICKVFDSTVSWSSKRQDMIAISTTESEYYALAETVREIKWLKALLTDFSIHISNSIPIFIDSQSCMKMVDNEKFSNRTKHIDVRYHFAKEEIVSGNIELIYEPTATNIADMLTKPLAGTKIKCLRELANIKELKNMSNHDFSRTQSDN